MNKQITQKEFRNQIRLVKSLAVTGFRWSGTPQLLLRLIRKEFDEAFRSRFLNTILQHHERLEMPECLQLLQY